MRFIGRWLRRILIALLVLVVLLLAPVGYNEFACRGDGETLSYSPIIEDTAWHRAEGRTLMTYPEWHIVHAYDDYAAVIRTGDPHDFGFFRAIGGFWGSLCALTQVSAEHGGFSGDIKPTIYVIGVSFSLELALKAAYEETLGRLFATFRGGDRAPLDDLSARQATDYAAFLQQVPWYRWDFSADAQALSQSRTDVVRDRERAFALGLEYRVKAAYAKAIAAAVASAGYDELRLRMVVSGIDAEELAGLIGVEIVGQTESGLIIETPRYRELTHLIVGMADKGAQFTEIAGNDDIMLTAISPKGEDHGALFAFDRQGYGDRRHLILLKVTELADWLRRTDRPTLEHIHDY